MMSSTMHRVRSCPMKSGARPGPGLGRHLFGIADHRVDLVHRGKTVRLDLCCAAGDDQPGLTGCRLRSLRISWRALRTASAVTAQVLTTTAFSSPPP